MYARLGDVKREAGVQSTLSACGVPIKPVDLMGCFRSDTKPGGLSRTPYAARVVKNSRSFQNLWLIR